MLDPTRLLLRKIAQRLRDRADSPSSSGSSLPRKTAFLEIAEIIDECVDDKEPG